MNSQNDQQEAEELHRLEASTECVEPEVGELLPLYATNDLTMEETRQVEEHLCVCDRCSLDLPELRRLNRLFRAIAREESARFGKVGRLAVW